MISRINSFSPAFGKVTKAAAEIALKSFRNNKDCMKSTSIDIEDINNNVPDVLIDCEKNILKKFFNSLISFDFAQPIYNVINLIDGKKVGSTTSFYDACVKAREEQEKINARPTKEERDIIIKEAIKKCV